MGTGEGSVDDDDRRFDFTGGALCLDFVNTVGTRFGSRPLDLLCGYADLVAWGRRAGVLDEQTAGALAARMAGRPDEADVALRGAVGLREALHRMLAVAAAGGMPAAGDLAILNGVLGPAIANAVVCAEGTKLAWGWREVSRPRPDRMVWPVALSAAKLLTGDYLGRVRVCANSVCGWLFIDASGRRRWCDMSTCGNRAKAARYYRRHRPGRGPAPDLG